MKWKVPYISLTLAVTSLITGITRQTQLRFFQLRGRAATVQFLYVFRVHSPVNALLLTFWRRNYFLILAHSVYKM